MRFLIKAILGGGLTLGAAAAIAGESDIQNLVKNGVPDCPFADGTKISPAADLPCSYDPNSEIVFGIGAYGGVDSGDGVGGVNANLFAPLSENFGIQVEGDVGLIGSGNVFGQIAGHAFIYDGSMGSLGAYGSWASNYSETSIERLGAEFSTALGSTSLTAVGGWQSVGKNNLFFNSKLSLSISDRNRIYGGYAYDNGSAGNLGFEHDFAQSGNTVTTGYVSAQIHEGGDITALAGLNIALGRSSAQNCPMPGARQPLSITHWAMSQASHPNPSAATRACTEADAGANLGLTFNGSLWTDGACFYGGATGTAVGSDVSNCGFSNSACP